MLLMLDRTALGKFWKRRNTTRIKLPAILVFLFSISFIFSFACSKKITELDKWPFEAKGIKITYSADHELNLYDDKAHTLFLCIYQLSDPNAFNDLRMDRMGVIKLLECKRFDESVTSSEKIIIHPEDEETIIYDRAEDARFVGIVAGYYYLWPDHVTRLMLVPVKVEETGRFFKKRTAMPELLSVNLYFSQEEIQQTLE